jgi:hypothetical protein
VILSSGGATRSVGRWTGALSHRGFQVDVDESAANTHTHRRRARRRRRKKEKKSGGFLHVHLAKKPLTRTRFPILSLSFLIVSCVVVVSHRHTQMDIGVHMYIVCEKNRKGEEILQVTFSSCIFEKVVGRLVGIEAAYDYTTAVRTRRSSTHALKQQQFTLFVCLFVFIATRNSLESDMSAYTFVQPYTITSP